MYRKMSPSPATRMSPHRDLRTENHKRRHSLESGISNRDKEDDLELFNEVRDKERENFLLDSNDNIDDIFSTKFGYFSGHKLGISAPSRGESSDLLNDGGNNRKDYEWLVTPPETPLFRSLDDEAPPQVNRAHTSRPTMERGEESSRSRASSSPHRRSPSPKPSKPFSVTRSSPPSRGHSPPRRSSTPTPRRIISTPSRTRGASPVKTGPKVKAWQSSIPGFSSEKPPNLRVDRPASYMRGSSSPTSGNGRKSISPGASRSIGSSRGSVVSSGDDDQDSLHSVGRDVGVLRKQTRALSRSAPKRSLDLGRQMDRKSPPNMFRPLLSGVPSSTFHASSPHYSAASKYSSITARSNPSTNLRTSGPKDTEINEPKQEDTKIDPFKDHDSYADDDIFVMDQTHDSSDKIDIKISQNPAVDTAGTIMDVKRSDFSDANVPPVNMVVVCSICGLIFNSSQVVVIVDGGPPICHESFTASNNTSFDDFSCARDSSNSKKSTFSASVSSSYDLGGFFSRQTDRRICRQMSGPNSDVGTYRYEMPTVHIRTDSSISGASTYLLHVTSEDGFEEFDKKTCSDPQEQEMCSTSCANTEKDDIFRTQEQLVLEEKNENLTSKFYDSGNDKSLPAQSQASEQDEDVGLRSSCGPNPSSFDGVSEIVNEDADVISDVDAIAQKSCMNEIQEDEDITESIEGFDVSIPGYHIRDESRILSEDTVETKPSSLVTLEEATEAILFCSSIVHSLAYEAADIAINKESPPNEVLRPAVGFLGGPDLKRRDNNMRLRTMRKRSPRVQRARQKKPEMDTKPLSSNAEADANSSPVIVGVRNEVDSVGPAKLESKCNCVIM
ncbi:proline-rich family protein [Striga asiatica]|uniref:Proline-rich family protein n=1 Tax=Striga asiatica TaxID=4170 RepID=A0A5A7RFU3_STRAF|nr:proline-rich family protein [Striga asiatica]